MSAESTASPGSGKVLERHLQFRGVLSNYPTGVSVVTTFAKRLSPIGMTVGSFLSISLEPPLVGFFGRKTSATVHEIVETGSFCVNILASTQEEIGRKFAGPMEARFSGVEWRSALSGAPILAGVLAWIDCRVQSFHELGDHIMIAGEVLALDVNPCAPKPLVFFRRGYTYPAAIEG